MKNFLLLLVLIPFTAFGHGDAESTSVGPGKGVESFVENEGFMLSKQAIKRLGIVTAPITSQQACNLKTIQVISVMDKKLIYVQRNLRFKPVLARCSEVKSSDQVVIKGAEFLRVIEMDLGGDEEEGEHEEHGEEHGEKHDKSSKKEVVKGATHD